MADKKISALTAATTPLAGTEVLPIVQSGATVKVSVDNLTEGKTVKAADLQLPWNDDAEVIFRFDDSYKWGLKNPSADNRSLRVFSKAADGAGRIIFAYGNDVEGMRLETTGNVEVATGNVVMKTAGKGIDFSANTHAAGMTSELLNDYEEGVWTIGLTFGGGSTGLAIDGQEAFYTRVGRLVHVSGRISLSNKGSSTGAAVLTGLPFTIANSNGARAGGDVSWYAAVLGVASINILGDANATTASLFIPGATGMTAMTDTNFTNTTSLYFSFTYIV
jgi:hypothetical protein